MRIIYNWLYTLCHVYIWFLKQVRYAYEITWGGIRDTWVWEFAWWYERWLVITKGFFISISRGTWQQRHKLPPADYPLICTSAISLSFSHSSSLTSPPLWSSPACHLMKQSAKFERPYNLFQHFSQSESFKYCSSSKWPLELSFRLDKLTFKSYVKNPTSTFQKPFWFAGKREGKGCFCLFC